MKIQQIEAKIAELTAQAKALQNQIDGFELDPDDYADQYDEMLDEVHGDFLGMNASYILKETDPTAYRCGLNDFVNSLDVEDSDEYKALQEEIDQLQSDIEDLENEIEDLENQIADLNE